uniref:Putative nitrophorin n=1 Tax=Panstrongylus lignarius TaxID=156445 RepID=A0A224XK89_9HEMI
MYTFRALIFVGIISLSTCRPEIQSQPQEQQQTKPNPLLNCPNIPAKQQFNATAYFHDVWHVVHSFNPDLPSNKSEDKTTCVKLTSQILENASVKLFYTQLIRQSELHTEWITNLDDLQNGVGKFVSERIDKEDDPPRPLSPLHTTVIDTDYSNYAVEHKCVAFRKGLFSGYLILNRKPNTLDPNVEPLLNKLELKLQDFILLSKPGCAEA